MINFKKIIFLTSLALINIFTNSIPVEAGIEENFSNKTFVKGHYSYYDYKKSTDQWWNDFEASKSKNIVQYVHDLSESNPEAAAWFLLTGGKDGFANRQATAEEEKLLMGAMGNLGQYYARTSFQHRTLLSYIVKNEIKSKSGLYNLYLTTNETQEAEYGNLLTKFQSDYISTNNYTHRQSLKDYFSKYCIYLIDNKFKWWNELLEEMAHKSIINSYELREYKNKIHQLKIKRENQYKLDIRMFK